MRRPLVAGNWKMNGTRDEARELVGGIVSRLASGRAGEADPEVAPQVAICPPYVYLTQVAELLAGSPVALGAQNVAREAPGAYTGEVAAEMLADVGCAYVLVGHSERRQRYGETDAVVAEKVARALAADLAPVLCLGETLAERESGATQAVVARQLDAVIEHVGVGALAQAVVAYEPVWAIGTGRTATPEQVQEVHAYLRIRVAERDARIGEGLRILYGGSVKAANARELFAMGDVDGGLIGGASLDAEEFVSICSAAA